VRSITRLHAYLIILRSSPASLHATLNYTATTRSSPPNICTLHAVPAVPANPAVHAAPVIHAIPADHAALDAPAFHAHPAAPADPNVTADPAVPTDPTAAQTTRVPSRRIAVPHTREQDTQTTPTASASASSSTGPQRATGTARTTLNALCAVMPYAINLFYCVLLTMFGPDNTTWGPQAKVSRTSIHCHSTTHLPPGCTLTSPSIPVLSSAHTFP
jgi:hypothetical protein